MKLLDTCAAVGAGAAGSRDKAALTRRGTLQFCTPPPCRAGRRTQRSRSLRWTRSSQLRPRCSTSLKAQRGGGATTLSPLLLSRGKEASLRCLDLTHTDAWCGSADVDPSAERDLLDDGEGYPNRCCFGSLHRLGGSLGSAAVPSRTPRRSEASDRGGHALLPRGDRNRESLQSRRGC